MNWRFFLALLLTGAVVVLTPFLFPPPPRAPAPVVVDSGGAPRAAPGAPDAPAVAGGGVPRGTTPASADTITPADTALVITPLVHYRLSNVGAALIGARMTEHFALGDSQPVELARPGQALLRMRIVAGADTLPLDSAPLAHEAAPDPRVQLFRGTVRGVPVSVRWSFAPDTYQVRVNREAQPIGYVSRFEVRAEGLSNAFLLVDLPRGFSTTEVDSMSDFRLLAYAYKPVASGADLIHFSSPDPGERLVQPGPLSWVVAKSKYFLVGVLALPPDGFAELQVRGVPRTGKFVTSGDATVLIPMRDGVASAEVYAGPQQFKRMLALGREFETANPYGGWMQGMIQPFATIVMRMLLWMKDVLELPYGWTLIIFGVFIRIVLWPLNQVAMRSSLKLQRIQPELAAAQKKFAGNPEKQREELMRIYKEHGMSPFSALSGCVPMLIPMPVLFALFFVFQNTIEFRGVSFWWMVDISQKDPLYVLPIVMGASMFLLSWIGVKNAPPNPQAKMMMYFLPGLMTFFLLNFAAGLNLYYAAQNMAAIPQQWLIARERAKLTSRSG